MFDLSAFIFLITLLLFIVGSIYPSAVDQNSRSRVLKIYGSATVILLVITVMLMPKHESEEKSINVKQQIANLPPEKHKYKIENDEAYLDIKRTVEVILPERIDEEMLRQIGKEIYGNRKKNFEKTFILYRIEGESTLTAWATTHFDPNIEVKIHGATKQQHERLLSQKHDDIPGLIGVWLCQYGAENKMIVYKKGEMAVIRFINADDTSFEDQYEIITFNGQIMLQSKREKSVGQYYKINTKGEMEFWNTNGNFYTAKPI